MAKKASDSFGLAHETIIEVVRTKGDEVVKRTMSYGAWLVMEKQSGYLYRAFQLGFSQH